MLPPTNRFDDLLRSLEEARLTDDELHRQNASLAERSASHDTLSTLRAEMVKARSEYTRELFGGRSEF